MSFSLYILVIAFLSLKIVTQGQLYQELVKSVVYTYFRFFACKNYDTEAAVLVTGQTSSKYVFLLFYL